VKTILAVASMMLICLGAAGCYHATIDTGLPPSNQQITQPFASSWVYGLVPPNVVETAAQCPRGVARVETQLSFVNQLVGFLTFGIYTPMDIRITCAAGSGASLLEETPDMGISQKANYDEIRNTLVRAAAQAIRTQQPVVVDLSGASE
jgi:hypothetical protein